MYVCMCVLPGRMFCGRSTLVGYLIPNPIHTFLICW